VAGSDSESFEKAASRSRDVGFLGELWGFLKSTKKWWLLPIIAVIVLFGLLVLLSGTGVAPFIYTLF
jgi:Family of unknown function (DUF5989)